MLKDCIPQEKYREECPVCRRAKKHCLCRYIKQFDNPFHFVILMSVAEAKYQRTGSGRLAHLTLKNSEIITGNDFTEDRRVNEIINDENESSSYFACKKALEELLDALKRGDNDYALYFVQSKISPMVNKKETFRFFLDCLIAVFEDLLNIQNNRPIALTNYDTILQDILENNHIDISSCLLELLKQRNMIGLNLNIPLQLDHIILSIVRSNIHESRK